MKTILILLLATGTFMMSCEKGDGPGPELRRKAEEKIMGKWSVERIVNQEYEPISTLKSTNEYPGTPEDYYNFKTSGAVEIGKAPGSKTEVVFKVINPSQIWIDDKYWWITELTATKLALHIDWNYVEDNKRSVTTIYLKR